MSAKNWATPQDMSAWMRQTEKRVMREERRPQVTKAADLLGPGIAPQAVEIVDWNGPETEFNGFFMTRPNALHTPNSAKWWIGTSIANPDGSGVQHVWDYRSGINPAPDWVRTYSLVGDTRLFGPWTLVTPQPERVFVVTSTTRPASPVQGQTIYETDTKLEYIWSGSAWVLAGASAGLLRRLGASQITTTSAAFTTAINRGTVTFSAVAGRTYRVNASATPRSDTAGGFTTMHLKYGIGASTGGTQFAGGLKDHRLASRRETLSRVGEFTYGGATGDSLNVVLVLVGAGGSSTDVATTDEPTILTVDEVLP